MIHRRTLITGLISFVAAPAIVRATNLMPVKVIKPLTNEEIILKALDKLMKNSVYGKFNYHSSNYFYYLNDQLIIKPISEEEFYDYS